MSLGPLVVALLLSSLLHAAFSFWLLSAFEMPAVDISFEMPMDVELGMSNEVAMASTPNAQPPSPAAPSSTPKALDPGEGEKRKPRKEKKERADAGAPATEKKANLSDAGTQSGADVAKEGSRLPPGAQIAVRVDMARIRSSPIAGDVRALLAAIPDWQALLAGSGIDPLEQLDRLLIATPNLQREKVVIAGRYVGTREVVEAAVTSLAGAREVAPTWRSQHGVETAPWANADSVERVIALVGPQHFTISRPEDLPRVLAIAAARKQAQDATPPAEALLSMNEGEGLSLEVEGVEQFVRRGRKGIPQRLRMSATEVAGQRVRIDAQLDFESPEKAADGHRFWDDLRSRYARNALVMMLGLGEPLADAKLETEDRQLRASVVLTAAQTKLILGYVRELVTPPAPLPPTSPADSPSAAP